MNDKELREYAQYLEYCSIASCLYGKNHKWESVEDIVDILDILKKDGWSKSNKLTADKNGIKQNGKVIISKIEEANMI
jgi:hypothetical protein